MQKKTGRAMLLLQQAFKSEAAGQDQQGLEHALSALSEFYKQGDRTGAAAAHHLAGVLNARLGHLKDAIEQLDSALPLRESSGDHEGVAALHQQRFEVALALRDTELAKQAGEQLLELMEKSGSREGQARALHQMAQLCMAAKDRPQAERLIERGLSLSEQDPQARSAFLSLQSQLAEEGGLSIAQSALELARTAGSRSAVVAALQVLAEQHIDAAQWQAAATLLEEALDSIELLRDVQQRGQVLARLATVETTLGQKESALDRLVYSARSFDETADRPAQMEVVHAAGELALELGRISHAIKLAREQVGLCQTLDDAGSLGAAYFVLGQRLVVASELEQAAGAFAKSAEQQQRAGRQEARGIALGMQGQVLAALGHIEGALEVLSLGEASLVQASSASLADIRSLLAEVRAMKQH